MFRFYINSSIHVALAVLAFTGVTLHHLSLPGNVNLLAFIFFASVTGYNMVKYADLAGFRHFNLPGQLQVIQIFSALCFAGMVYSSFQLSWPVIAAAVSMGFLTFFYALPFINRSNLRSVAGIKILIIALVWAGTTVLLPALNAEMFDRDTAIEFIQRFLFVMVLMLPFEIRDLQFDKPELATLPQTIGIRNTKKVGGMLLLGIVLLEPFETSVSLYHSPALLGICLITFLFLMGSNMNNSPWYTSFWVEAIPIGWWAGLMISGGG